MKKIILLIVLINSFHTFSQISQIQEVKTDIVNKEDYESLMVYKCRFYKTKNSNHLYLKGFKSDGSQLISINNDFSIRRNLKLEKLPYNGIPKKIIKTELNTNILYHYRKTFYITSINNETNNISNLEIKTKIKTKHVIKYIVNEKSFIVAYIDKKVKNVINFWVFDFDKKTEEQKSVNFENLSYDETFYDIDKNILVLSKSEDCTTKFSVINLKNFTQKEFNYGYPDFSDSKPLFNSTIYNGTLIQVFLNLNSLKIHFYENYLNNRTLKLYEINENNVNYYTRKNMFSKKNVETFEKFLTKTRNSIGINIEPFSVNNIITLFIDIRGMSYSNNGVGVISVGGGITLGGGSSNEYSLGKIKTSINNNNLLKYSKQTPKEKINKFKSQIDGDLVMESNFELNNKVYLTYYDIKTKHLKILEVFK